MATKVNSITGTEREDNSTEQDLIVSKLKKQHGTVFRVIVDDELVFFFKKPDMNTISIFLRYIEADPAKANVLLFKNCLINTEMLQYEHDVDVMMAILPTLSGLVEQRKAVLEKL